MPTEDVEYDALLGELERRRDRVTDLIRLGMAVDEAAGLRFATAGDVREAFRD